MNGIIFWENGEVQLIGHLATVRLIAQKVQEIIPDLVQQERNAVLDTMSDKELKRVIDRMKTKQTEDI